MQRIYSSGNLPLWHCHWILLCWQLALNKKKRIPKIQGISNPRLFVQKYLRSVFQDKKMCPKNSLCFPTKSHLKRQGSKNIHPKSCFGNAPPNSPRCPFKKHPSTAGCKCLGIFSFCLSSWPSWWVRGSKFAICTDWLIRKLGNHNYLFWLRSWWLITEQIRIMNMNALLMRLYRTILT